MNETSEGGAAFSISIGLAFVGGYADASSYLLARTFKGHLTGNCVLAAVSAASGDWHLTLDRLLAVIVFLIGILSSLTLNRFAPNRWRPSSLAIAMLIEVLLCLGAALFLSHSANKELFIVCMCLALCIQNGALHKTNGISVHSTYMTGMVTMLIKKSFDHLFKAESSRGLFKRPRSAHHSGSGTDVDQFHFGCSDGCLNDLTFPPAWPSGNGVTADSVNTSRNEEETADERHDTARFLKDQHTP